MTREQRIYQMDCQLNSIRRVWEFVWPSLTPFDELYRCWQKMLVIANSYEETSKDVS